MSTLPYNYFFKYDHDYILNDQVAPEDVWKWIKFTLEKTITFKTLYCVLICQRLVKQHVDRCHYAVWKSCHMKKKPKCHQKSAPYQERNRTCHHEFNNLVDKYDLWWYKKNKINGMTWIEGAQGCVFCEGICVIGEE